MEYREFRFSDQPICNQSFKTKKQVYAQIDFMPDRSFGEVNDLLKLRFCMNAHGKMPLRR